MPFTCTNRFKGSIRVKRVGLRSSSGSCRKGAVAELGLAALVMMVVLATVAGCTLPTPPPPAPPTAGTPIAVQVSTWCDPAGNPGTQAQCVASHVSWDPSLSSINQAVRVRAILGTATYFPIVWVGRLPRGADRWELRERGGRVDRGVQPRGPRGRLDGLVNGVPNPNCEGGFDGDAGASCRIPLPAQIVVGDVYTYRLSLERRPVGSAARRYCRRAR